MQLTDEIKRRITEWTSPLYKQDCINEIKKLVADDNIMELNERFGAELSFGTGGIRGILGFGTNRMNIYIIAKVTQGLANYIIKNKIKEPKAAIAYDSRYFSREFAEKAAQILASNGIKTYLFKEMRPTPLLSYTIRYLKCTTGIVITASHNPKQYNGYKVYWDDGAQIINPHDKGVIEEVRNIKSLNQVVEKNFNDLNSKGMISWLGDELDALFIDEILKLSLNKGKLAQSNLKIVYTPLHGTGKTLIPKAFAELGLNHVITVPEQMKPDPDFTTVKYPNPEERDALTLAINLAEANQADLVIATDPDADRMGIAIRNHNGGYEVINGNQIGSLLEYYILKNKKEKNLLAANSAIVKTIVTTELQDAIAANYGVKVFNVLTGFKYICSKMNHFDKDHNYQYVFGGEESFGYLTGAYTRDKDAVGSSLMIAECAAVLKLENKSLLDLLEEIYVKYGYFMDGLVSKEFEGLSGQTIITKIMNYFRENKLTSLKGLNVTKNLDYKNDEIPDAIGSKYILPKSDVIQYYFDDGSRITLRPSGTEPKIKFYFTVKGKDKKEAELKLRNIEEQFVRVVDKIVKMA